jgi:hypothetical protein
MKDKEQQDGFNTKMLQSLDRIEKKMDKETESSKSRVIDLMPEGKNLEV